MSLRHAANRFHRTPVDGWDGVKWVSNVSKITLLTNQRFVSDREFGSKLRNVLVDPQFPVPSQYSVIRAGGPDQIYLVGRNNVDAFDAPYSVILGLRQSYFTCQIVTFTTHLAASGVPTHPVRTLSQPLFCDRENITLNASKEFPSIKFGDELVILPTGTVITTANEILIDGNYYEVGEVYDYVGMRACRCTVKRVPT